MLSLDLVHIKYIHKHIYLIFFIILYLFQKKKKILYNSKIEESSLTRLFVYKVLNQEVLDDRGELSNFQSERKI